MRARERHSSVRLAALTGFGQAKDKQRALDAGFDTHMTKPPDFTVLLQFLEDVATEPAR